MKIEHTQSGNVGRFFVDLLGERLAELVYTITFEKFMTIEHTCVLPSLRGKGVGKQLLEAAAAHCRIHQLKIIAHCTFASAVFNKSSHYADVLA